MSTRLAALLALPLIAGCLDDAELADTELSDTESDVLIGSTRLTFYQHADLTGTTFSVDLPPLDSYERVRAISQPDINTAGLTGRTSAVRLRCGSRAARVVLLDTHNQSNTSFSSWSHLGGNGYTINCQPYETKTINLHVSRPILADRVGSAILVTHAADAEFLNFSDYLESAWGVALDQLPSEATPTKTEMWLSTTRRFHIRQYLTIDHWACTERGGVFEYSVLMRDDGTFSASLVDSYVDYGLGDSWGCRDKMKASLDASARGATDDLEAGLSQLVSTLAGHHRRYYFVPEVTLRAFDLFYGADPIVNAPL